MNRGFTIVELTIVMAVIAVLTGISLAITSTYQNKSNDAKVKSLAAVTRSAAEQYYVNNNEYPSASLLYGGTSNCTKPSSYSSAISTLRVANNTFDNTTLIPHIMSGYSSCSFDKKAVYYFSGTGRLYIGSCYYEMSDGANLSFLLLYWSINDNRWIPASGTKGTISASDSACGIKAL